MKPILKWAGGKSKLVNEIQLLYSKSECTRYIDLFCGSLAFPLEATPTSAVLNDVNSALISMYECVKRNPEGLLRELERLNGNDCNTKAKFVSLRDEYNTLKRQDTIEDKARFAALFIYLNKRSFNGLYRESRSGVYNVPYKEYKTDIYSEADVLSLSKYLNENDVILSSKDFREFHLSSFSENDLVYLDPPYYPSRKSQFTSYWKTPFQVEEQQALCEFCKALDRKGVKFILSNSPCDEIREMYKDFRQKTLYIGRQMRSGKGKSAVYSDKHEPNEILIWNF